MSKSKHVLRDSVSQIRQIKENIFILFTNTNGSIHLSSHRHRVPFGVCRSHWVVLEAKEYSSFWNINAFKMIKF